jgi:hypothetical protein
LIEHLPRAPANAGFVFLQRRESGFDGAIVFFLRQAQTRLPTPAASGWRRALRSAKLSTGSMYFTLCSANTSFSLVNAAFTVSGVAVTVGQALVPCSFTSGLESTSYMGKKITFSGFLRCFS